MGIIFPISLCFISFSFSVTAERSCNKGYFRSKLGTRESATSKEKPNEELNPSTAQQSAQAEPFPYTALYFCVCFIFLSLLNNDNYFYSHLSVSTLNGDTEITKSPPNCIQVLLLIQHEHENVYSESFWQKHLCSIRISRFAAQYTQNANFHVHVLGQLYKAEPLTSQVCKEKVSAPHVLREQTRVKKTVRNLWGSWKTTRTK